MDERLFNRCLKNIHNELYFKKLYDYYYRRIVLHINNKYHMGDLAEDVAQECFISLLNLKDIKYIEHYTSWLYKICDNLALRKLNIENLEKQKIVVTEPPSIGVSKFELFGEFQRDIECLDSITQEIFYYHYVESYSFKEIADIIEISYDSVRQKHHRALEELRKIKKLSRKTLLSVLL